MYGASLTRGSDSRGVQRMGIHMGISVVYNRLHISDGEEIVLEEDHKSIRIDTAVYSGLRAHIMQEPELSSIHSLPQT